MLCARCNLYIHCNLASRKRRQNFSARIHMDWWTRACVWKRKKMGRRTKVAQTKWHLVRIFFFASTACISYWHKCEHTHKKKEVNEFDVEKLHNFSKANEKSVQLNSILDNEQQQQQRNEYSLCCSYGITVNSVVLSILLSSAIHSCCAFSLACIFSLSLVLSLSACLLHSFWRSLARGLLITPLLYILICAWYVCLYDVNFGFFEKI